MEIKIKIFFRKNLKMSPQKLAAQCGHAALGLQPIKHDSIAVLQASDKKFYEIIETLERQGTRHHVVTDAGRTELEPGTQTCLAYAVLEDRDE